MPRSRAITTNTTTITTRTTIAALVSGALLITAACGGSDDSGSDVAASPTTTPVTTTAPTTTSAPTTTVAETTVPTTEPAPDPTTPPTTAEQVDDETWRNEVDAACSHGVGIFSIAEPGGDAESLEAFVAAHREIHEAAPSTDSVEFSGPGRTPDDMREITAGIDDALDRAAEAARAGDFVGTLDEIDATTRSLGYFASAYASEGQSCGPADAERAAGAALNVSILSPWQLEVGFGSVWVSQYLSPTVLRIDPDTGEVLAKIDDLPSTPIKLQPADGRMHVRTFDSYVSIDAASNAVVDTLLMADVGPDAGRSWALDGALWICDGRRLHRYDPSTMTPVAVVELDVDCGQVYATADLAIAWSYNEDPGESGTSRAAFIDPATNSAISSVDLPFDAGVPVVLDDVVFFPPQLGTHASVIDRSTWTVTSTPDMGRIGEGSQPTFDGTSIYVIADKLTGSIAVIDPTTFEVTGEILAVGPDLGLNSLAATPGTVWAVNHGGGLLQRFDTTS